MKRICSKEENLIYIYVIKLFSRSLNGRYWGGLERIVDEKLGDLGFNFVCLTLVKLFDFNGF